MKKKLAIVLGIRPDVIRASLVINQVRADKRFDIKFIWSGQHYSDNLKDIFFRELDVAPPDIELKCAGDTDAAVVGQIVTNLFPVLDDLKPEACVFLGDTNTVMGCLAAAQLNIPIVHIEGCMRSYDWRMPEEKYRSTIDHLSDHIYAYLDEYKAQGVAEGLNPANISVVGNPIVDIIQKYYYSRKSSYDEMASPSFFSERGLAKGDFYLMTCHRRENVHDRNSLENIINLTGTTDRTVFFPASYRTQKVLKEEGLTLPKNVKMVDPIGYVEMLVLMTNSRGIITDSGTVVEEACVLQVPCVQVRRSTERPQVYDVGASVKFDPGNISQNPCAVVIEKLEGLYGKSWENPFGDGNSSKRIADDLLSRLEEGRFNGHKAENYHVPIHHSYRTDGL